MHVECSVAFCNTCTSFIGLLPMMKYVALVLRKEVQIALLLVNVAQVLLLDDSNFFVCINSGSLRKGLIG